MPTPTRLIAIERDGTLNQWPEDFMGSPEDWVPLPGALEAVARLNQAGWRVVVYASQSGLARGLFDMSTVNAVHARMHKMLAEVGARVESVFFCPHLPDEPCECSLLDAGLFKQIAERTGTPLTHMVMAGGTLPYLLVARDVGCATHLVLAGRASSDALVQRPDGVVVHADLMALADALLGQTASGET